MRKSTWLARVLGALIVFAMASNVHAVTWSGGFKGGINLGKFSGDDTGISDSESDGGLTITIDGKELKAAYGETILTVADRAGIRIPTLCRKYC